MIKYANTTSHSDISFYEIGADYIKVQFAEGLKRTYSYAKAGKAHVEEMKALAQRGSGLLRYIMKNVKNLWDGAGEPEFARQ